MPQEDKSPHVNDPEPYLPSSHLSRPPAQEDPKNQRTWYRSPRIVVGMSLRVQDLCGKGRWVAALRPFSVSWFWVVGFRVQV